MSVDVAIWVGWLIGLIGGGYCGRLFGRKHVVKMMAREIVLGGEVLAMVKRNRADQRFVGDRATVTSSISFESYGQRWDLSLVKAEVQAGDE